MTSPAAELVHIYLDRLRLQTLLGLPGVEDVAVQEPGVVWVRQGTWSRHEVPECDLLTLEELAIVSGSLRQQEHGAHKPILDTELPGEERLHVNSFPTVPLGTIAITFRKHENKVAPIETITHRYLTEGWNAYEQRAGRDLGSLLELYRAGEIVPFLRACVRARLNIILAGATGSSKTTMLNTIVSAIDHSRRLITIEDAMELKPLQPNVVRLLFKRDDLSERTINPDILLQAALRMHPDLVFLGEMRGREAMTFVADVVPAHPGSFCTVHATTPSAAFQRIIGLCKSTTAGASYDDRSLAMIVANAVDVIVPLEQLETKEFKINPVWFVGEAQSRGQTALELLR